MDTDKNRMFVLDVCTGEFEYGAIGSEKVLFRYYDLRHREKKSTLV